MPGFQYAPFLDSFSNDSPTPEIYTLSLHDALPISPLIRLFLLVLILLLMPTLNFLPVWFALSLLRFRLPSKRDRKSGSAGMPRPISYAVFCLKKKRFREQGFAGDLVSALHSAARIALARGDLERADAQ